MNGHIPPALDIHSLSVKYGDRLALENISLTLRAGETTAVVGPNGAGKSTLIRAISGVTPVCAGGIRLDGIPLEQLDATQRARRMAVVPQARHLPGGYTVYQTVLLGRTPHLNWFGQANRSDRQQVLQAIRRTQLEDLADRMVGELSGGEQQRVLLARALAQNSPILLLDEPTTYLDLRHQMDFLNLVQNLAAEQGLAVLITLHDLNLAARYAGTVALLASGRLAALGTAQEVLTAEMLSQVYGVPVQVIPHPELGTPLILAG
jgi:iron complex transport system ATP-binding protein